MKICELGIDNILSFSSTGARFEDYNIIVGQNAAGKTNLVRILQKFGGPKSDNNMVMPFDKIPLSVLERRIPDRPSSLDLKLNLSKIEAKILLQFLGGKTVNAFHEILQSVRIVILWSASPNDVEEPDFMFMRLGNGFSVWKVTNKHWMGMVRDVPDNSHDLRNLLTRYSEATDQDIRDLLLEPKPMFSINTFWESFINGKDLGKFFILREQNISISTQLPAMKYIRESRQVHISEIFEFCNVDKYNVNLRIDLWTVLHSILKNSLIFVNEFRHGVPALATRLISLRDSESEGFKFDRIVKKFSDLFPRTQFKVYRDKQNKNNTSTQANAYVRIIENDVTRVNLGDSASGYYEALHIFSELESTDDSVLLLDEPALHLHPNKISQLSRDLIMSRKQVILITHSPFFIDASTFRIGRNVVYVKKQNDGESIVYSKPRYFSLGLKEHVFKPEIFFARCCIFVEGPGDAACLAAISDKLNGIFQKYDISLVYGDGKGTVERYHKVITAYDLNHVCMVDEDYEGVITANFVINRPKLEVELAKLGIVVPLVGSIDPEIAYDRVFGIMETKRDEVKNGNLGKVISKAFSNIGLNEQDLDYLWKGDYFA